ncbi:hypothetical protein [Nocardioides sp. AE5]|uniref:hypothetical protein n=1 Tax=Nocardioides sp. AE5 TaxID=2962573 RepID=UPI002881E5AD|nr:hypothetical protein [Nocardioides sp. AE5]MDT0201040.1 hypothetical protein [Nocardioides sp. AE5]
MAETNDENDEEVAQSQGRNRMTRGADIDVDLIRTRVAQVLWFLCALFALILALGALTFALKANTDNSLVGFIRDTADTLDLGIFGITNGIKEFDGENAEVKNALFNWGLGAVFWLILGRLADRFIRP